MAKKKGKREEIFTFPEFNRDEYRTKEIRDSKVTLLSVFYALVVAVICYSLVRMAGIGGWVTIIGFIAPLGLTKVIPLFFDTSEFERKNWMGPMFMSFMAWLGFMILLSNPPFNDIAKPKFQGVDMYVEIDGAWNETVEIDEDTAFVLVVSVKDNWEVESVTITSGAAGLNSQLMPKLEENNEYNITGNSWHYYAFEGLKSGSYSFTINAEDSEGNSNTKKISITIG
tara:strand:- start:5023 stop:5703 length:681 start_codon:yes stop_codon:yes gene_type:complete